MVATIFLVIITLAFLVAVAVAFLSAEGRFAGILVGAVLLVGGLILGGTTTIYQQDPGQAFVLRSASGATIGQTTDEGFHVKAPWVKAVGFDVRNNTVRFVGDGSGDNAGGVATGPQITFQDSDGVSGNADVVVTYSLAGDAVERIYADYRTQESFVSKVVVNDVRGVVRKAPGAFSTMDVLTKQGDVEGAIRAALTAKWEPKGLIVEDVALQEVRYSESVKERLDEAMAARIAVDKAEAEQDQARIEAETELIRQQGIADANAVLTESLTPEVLEQKRIDALAKAGAVYVVPEGSTPFVQVNPSP